MRNQNGNPAYQLIKVATVGADVFKFSAAAALFPFLVACTAPNSVESKSAENTQMANKQAKGPILILNTVMTAEGVECAAVRGSDGTLYTIPSMPHTFKQGDKLNIMVADPIVPFASFCQQGETIEWIRIEQVSDNGEILKFWEK